MHVQRAEVPAQARWAGPPRARPKSGRAMPAPGQNHRTLAGPSGLGPYDHLYICLLELFSAPRPVASPRPLGLAGGVPSPRSGRRVRTGWRRRRGPHQREDLAHGERLRRAPRHREPVRAGATSSSTYKLEVSVRLAGGFNLADLYPSSSPASWLSGALR